MDGGGAVIAIVVIVVVIIIVIMPIRAHSVCKPVFAMLAHVLTEEPVRDALMKHLCMRDQCNLAAALENASCISPPVTMEALWYFIRQGAPFRILRQLYVLGPPSTAYAQTLHFFLSFSSIRGGFVYVPITRYSSTYMLGVCKFTWEFIVPVAMTHKTRTGDFPDDRMRVVLNRFIALGCGWDGFSQLLSRLRSREMAAQRLYRPDAFFYAALAYNNFPLAHAIFGASDEVWQLKIRKHNTLAWEHATRGMLCIESFNTYGDLCNILLDIGPCKFHHLSNIIVFLAREKAAPSSLSSLSPRQTIDFLYNAIPKTKRGKSVLPCQKWTRLRNYITHDYFCEFGSVNIWQFLGKYGPQILDDMKKSEYMRMLANGNDETAVKIMNC